MVNGFSERNVFMPAWAADQIEYSPVWLLLSQLGSSLMPLFEHDSLNAVSEAFQTQRD